MAMIKHGNSVVMRPCRLYLDRVGISRSLETQAIAGNVLPMMILSHVHMLTRSPAEVFMAPAFSQAGHCHMAEMVNHTTRQKYLSSITSITLRVPLSETDLKGLRNARKRRELRASCPDVQIEVNRQLQVLEICGTPEAVQLAERQVAQRIGPQKEVSAGLWSELCRTRHDEGGLMNQILARTGSRVHLERDALKVRLFGGVHAVALASAHLDQLEEKVMEFRYNAAAKLNKDVLEMLKKKIGVTLCLEGNEVWVRGFKPTVQQAVMEIEDISRASNQLPDKGSGHATTPNQSSTWVVSSQHICSPLPCVPLAVVVIVGSGQVGLGPHAAALGRWHDFQNTQVRPFSSMTR